MSKPKSGLPDDLKKTSLGIFNGYKRRVKWYHEQRRNIIESGAANFSTYTEEINGKKTECRVYFGHGSSVGRPIESKGDALLALEYHPETIRMRAVEQAKLTVGHDCANEETRQRLLDSILLNCENGRNYPFEILNLTEFSRSDFYRRRDKFLLEIAKYLDMA